MARGDSLFRQWELIRTLQAHHYGLGVDELAARLECTRRTVQRDLAVMKDVFPLQCETRDYGKKFWKLAANFLESDELQLSVTEMISLFFSQQLLAPLAGTQFGNGLATALQKIKALLPSKALHYFSAMEDAYLVKALGSYDYSGEDKLITILNQGIIDQRTVEVTYGSTSQKRQVTTDFQPYGMVLLGATLYCIGYLAEYDEIRTLKVARLKAAQLTDFEFERPSTFSLTKHVHGSFGVFRSGKLQTVRARFSGWAARNVREYKWHHSQAITKDDGETVVVTFELGNTIEFKRWILGFGSFAQVMKPKKLADEVTQELKQALSHYE